MLFNFVLAGAGTMRLMELEDTLSPVVWGLRGAGHSVIAFARQFAPAPAVNLIVNGGLPEEVGVILAHAREQAGADVCVGLLCPDDLTGTGALAEAALLHAAEAVRFVWICAPTAQFDGILAASRLALVRFGFHPALEGAKPVMEARRTVGAVLYGDDTPYRAALAERLSQTAPQSFFVRPGHFPDYIVTDLLSRAALVVVTRSSDTDGQAPPAARIVKAICNSVEVVVEAGPGFEAPLAAYTTPWPYDEIASRCRAAMQAGGRAEAGARGLSRFRAETSMMQGLEEAIVVAAKAVGG